MLCSMMQSHPDVLCHHEVFNPEGCYYALPLRNTDFELDSIQERNSNPLAFLNRLWNKNLGHPCVGFKMTLFQQAEILDAVCRDDSVHKIVLTRKATLKTYVSQLIAEESGVWEDYRPNSIATSPKSVFVDYDKLKTSILENRHFYKYLDTAIVGPRSDIQYEALTLKNEQYRLLQEMGLQICELKEQSRRQNPHSLSELIKNKNQLKEIFTSEPDDKALLHELIGQA